MTHEARKSLPRHCHSLHISVRLRFMAVSSGMSSDLAIAFIEVKFF